MLTKIETMLRLSAHLDLVITQNISSMEEAPLYPQLTCPKPHHSTQPLMFVCLDYKCDNHTPICYSCKKEAHANHTTEDIGFFFKKLNEELTSRDLKEVEALLAKLGNLRQYCLEILRKER